MLVKPFQFDRKHLAERSSPQVITRASLETDSASALIRQDAPNASLLTDAARKSSLATCLASRPSGDIWVFGYGSLIWNPAFKSAERRLARVNGWHRSFCLSMPAGRGTPERPGLALGLDRGGACTGVAYKIDDQDAPSELDLLWKREMLLGGYEPRWIELFGIDGKRFGSSITFVIDRTHSNYAGGLAAKETVHRLSTATGSWGSSADYLFRTVDALRTHGIADLEMEKFGKLVEAAMLRKNLAAVA